jgi:hypothetical protein
MPDPERIGKTRAVFAMSDKQIYVKRDEVWPKSSGLGAISSPASPAGTRVHRETGLRAQMTYKTAAERWLEWLVLARWRDLGV